MQKSKGGFKSEKAKTTKFCQLVGTGCLIFSVSTGLISVMIEMETGSLSLSTTLKDCSILLSWIALLLTTSPTLLPYTKEQDSSQPLSKTEGLLYLSEPMALTTSGNQSENPTKPHYLSRVK